LGVLALLLLPLSTASRAAHASPLRVAAAADLALAFRDIGAAWAQATGDQAVFTFGSTGLLEKQLAEGAPFDLFAAANVSYADDAIAAGVCAADKTHYALGRVVVWWRKDATVAAPRSLADLADARFKKIALANPMHAPYGMAARAALQHAGVWGALERRLVYGENVQQTLQFAQTGNADLALVALSLATVTPDGEWLPIAAGEHAPIDQAMVVCGRDAARLTRARSFATFVASPRGRAILLRYGFTPPGETKTAAAR
jgi:molybdate transport system substrate-binding protein